MTSEQQAAIVKRLDDLRNEARRDGFTPRHPVRWDQFEELLGIVEQLTHNNST